MDMSENIIKDKFGRYCFTWNEQLFPCGFYKIAKDAFNNGKEFVSGRYDKQREEVEGMCGLGDFLFPSKTVKQ